MVTDGTSVRLYNNMLIDTWPCCDLSGCSQ